MNPLSEFYRLFSIPIQVSRNKTVSKPFSIGLNVSERCNSRCSMCDFWKHPGKRLDLHEMKHILNSIKRFGVNIINYSAHGEMFTNPDILKALEYGNSFNFITNLNTNALALSDQSLANHVGHDIKPFLISIGLDTVRPETYEKIRGVKGGFQRVMKALDNLTQVGFKNITVGCVILNHNLNDLIPLAKLVSERGLGAIRFTAYQRFFQHGDRVSEALRDETYLATLEKNIDALVSLKGKYPVRNTSHYLKSIPDFYRAEHYFPMRCFVGFRRMDISETGDVTLCPFMNATIGNVFESDIGDIWFSQRAERLRHKMLQGQCPGCWLSCYAEENIRFTLRHGLQANFEGLLRYIRLLRNN